MKKLEYIIVQLLSLAGLEFGLFCALGWYWSCFEWSPFGYETCGLEMLVFWFFVWPSFLLAMLLKLGLLPRWKYPHCVWYLPLALCGIAALPFFKSLWLGIYCIALMVFLPFLELYGILHADRRPDTESSPGAAARGEVGSQKIIMRYVKIAVCVLSLVLPVVLYLLLDPAVRLSTWNLCSGAAGALVFLDLPIALCLLHWLRPQWFRLKKSNWLSPFPWLVLMLACWIYVAGEMYFSVRLGRGPENGFSAFCAYCFGWAYIWLTMIPIGLLYQLIRMAAWAVTRLRSSFNRRN